MRKRLLAALLAAVMMLSFLPTALAVDAKSTDCVIAAENISARPGATVEVDVTMRGNPGILGMVLKIAYDGDALTMTGASNGDALAALNYTAPKRYRSAGTTFTWYGEDISASDVKDGTVLTLTFTVSADAEEGTYPITLSYEEGAIYGGDLSYLDVALENGGVTVVSYEPGDVNDDGRINSMDLTLIARYIADDCTTDPDGYNVTINRSAANVNDDGRINAMDLTLIARYIADGCTTDPEGYNVRPIPEGKSHTHTLTAVAAREATCTEDGNIAYWYCSECGKYFSDAAAKTEIALADTVLSATGHDFVNGVCTVCGSMDLAAGTKCTIQYNVGMINSSDPSEVAKIADDTYTVGTAKALPTLKMDTYTFVGWTDQNGNFYANNVIPAGVTGNLILTDNWVSQRNQAKVKNKLDDPLIVEDTDNQMIYFGYEIGTIENVPLYTTQDLLCVNGIISVKEKTTQHSLTKSEMSTVGSTISKETVDSTQVTLSEELTAATQVNEEKATSQGYDKTNAETYARSQTNTQSYSSSSGGSSESYVYNDSTHRNEQNTGYVVNENFDTGISFELQTGIKNTTEVSAGIGLPIDIIKVDAGVKNTTEVSLDTDTKTYADYAIGTTTTWDGHTYDESYQANSTTDTKTWNSTSSASTAITASQTSSVSEAFHEMIANTYSYGESYSKTKGSSTLRGLAQSSGQTDETSFTVTYTEQEILSETVSFQSTGNTFGSYRLVMMGTIHVFAIVGYDVANREYFVYTLNVMGDGSKNDGWHEEIDYSYDRSFSDHENSVIPFAIPMYVENYVNSRIVSTAGLEYEFDNKNHTATVEAYHGTDKIVYIPSYMVDEEGTAYKVTAVKASTFRGNSDIVAVSLGRYVSEIPDSAFEGCTSLEYVICPAVRSIGSRAFFGCESLKEFQLSEQITHLGSNAFEGVPAVIAEVGYYADTPETAKEVAEMAASSGADSITLDLSNVPADTELNLNVDQGGSFVLKGGEKTFTRLSLASHAATVRLESINISAAMGIPVKLYAANIILYKSEIRTGSAYAMLLGNDDVSLTLSGTNAVISSGKAGIVCGNVAVSYTNSGKLKMTGDILCCGTVTDANGRIEFISGKIVPITAEEYGRYKQGMFTVTLDPNGGALPESAANTVVAYYGMPIGELPVPSRDYYTFDGWYTDGGEKVTAEKVFEEANDATVTVYARWTRNSFDITFDANGGTVSEDSRKVYYGDAVGELPVPARENWSFVGWFTEDGTQVSDGTVFGEVEDITLRARWQSDWVLASELPEGAQAVDQKWTYTRTQKTESTESGLSGWTQTGSHWKKTGSGSTNYASFPSGYSDSDQYYTSFARSGYSAYDNGSTKREVSNTFAGYVYWHWMYNVRYANTTERAISSVYGVGNCYYFRAFTSTVDCPYLDNYYCNSQNLPSYNCSSLCWDSGSSTDGNGTPRYFRFPYYTSTYTDYQKIYEYQLVTQEASASAVEAGGEITNVQAWVQYIAK